MKVENEANEIDSKVKGTWPQKFNVNTIPSYEEKASEEQIAYELMAKYRKNNGSLG